MTLLTSGGQGFSLERGGRQPSVSAVPINKSVAWSALIIALTQPHALLPSLLRITAIPPFHLLALLLVQPEDLFSLQNTRQRRFRLMAFCTWRHLRSPARPHESHQPSAEYLFPFPVLFLAEHTSVTRRPLRRCVPLRQEFE